MKLGYCCLVAGLLSALSSAQDFQGTWQASVREHGEAVRYVVHISKKNQAAAATYDVPESFVFDNAVDSVGVENSTLRFRAGLVSFDGSLSADSKSIAGTWSLGAEKQNVTFQRVASPTPDRVESVARKLQSLSYLPAEKWKFHAGDIPHGEAIDLEDSSWDLVRAGSVAPHDAVWYRRLIEIPTALNGYDLIGSKIWFDFQYDANGPVTEIIYFNGRRIAMGDDLEPIVLLEQARPGDKVLIAVKLLGSVDQKHFNGVRLRVEFAGQRPNPAT